MKHSYLHFVFLVFILFYVSSYANDGKPAIDIGLTNVEETFHTFSPVQLEYESFSLSADSGALIHDLTIYVEQLSSKKAADMSIEMVNVTGANSDAYRLLPNGTHFSTPAIITIPYDEYRLPTGYSYSSIHTYYFDEDIAQWRQLERISIDTVAHTVSSYTTHFTDFANAVIKMPELPEFKAYVPTEMTDQPDANPLQGIPMIASPTANYLGTNELTYPIEIPAGRMGMQPNLDLHYSSANGNGVLGVGWSLHTSAITIDTRWGVPRYDVAKETEAYLLDGEQLVLHNASGEALPLPHQISNGQFQSRQYGQVVYHARNTKNQDRIVRYGRSLKDMYWVVTDRNGTSKYYGYDPIESTIVESAVIRNMEGAIGYWALTAEVDIHGNYVLYTYTKVKNELILTYVDYTGHIGSERMQPNYFVHFYYENCPDSTNNGRLGVLQSHTKRIKCIEVVMQDGHPIRHYKLSYENTSGSLNKSRLISITREDAPTDCYCGGSEIVSDTISEFINNDYNLSKALEDLSMYEIQEQEPGTITSFSYADAVPLENIYIGNPQTIPFPSISESSNHQWSIGGTATVGIGFVSAITNLSIGGNYDYSQTSGSLSTMFIDIDGDGLVDRLFEDAGTVYYNKQRSNGTWETDPRIISGFTSLPREVSSTNSFGVQASARLGIEKIFSLGADFSYSPQYSTSYTDVYFTDVNADGLPDLVTPNGIRYNLMENRRPQLEAVASSDYSVTVNNSCCGVVYRDGEVDPNLECEKSWVLDTIVGLSYSAQTAHSDRPLGGDRNRSPIPEYTYAEQDIYHPDAPQHGDNFFPIEQWGDGLTILQDPFPQVFRPQQESTYTLNIDTVWLGPDYHIISVEDSLYIYHLETYCKDTSTIPNVDIVRVWVAPHAGTINVNSSIHILQDTTLSRQFAAKMDGVTYTIQYHDSLPLVDSILYQGVIDAESTEYQTSQFRLSVNEHAVLLFRLSANSDRRFDDTEWEIDINYNGTSERYNSASDYVCTDNKYFSAPTDGNAHYTYQYKIDSVSSQFSILVLKNGSTILSQQSFNAANSHTEDVVSDDCSLRTGDSIQFILTYTGTEPKWSDIHITPSVYFSFLDTLANNSVEDRYGDYPVDVQINCSSIIPNENHRYRQLFGKLHRGWGQFAYRDDEHSRMIDLGSLTNSEIGRGNTLMADTAAIFGGISAIDTTQLIGFDSSSDLMRSIDNYNPLSISNKWVPMHANSQTEEWEAYGRLGRIGKKLHSTSKPILTPVSVSTYSASDNNVYAVEYDSPIPITSSVTPRVDFVRKKTSSCLHNVAASVGASVGELSLGPCKNESWGSNTVDVDYLDMNGDGFPDFVSQNIQYSEPWGGMGTTSRPTTIGLPQGYNESYGRGFTGGINMWQKTISNDPKRQLGSNSSTGKGNSKSDMQCSYVDLNADGLPDYVDIVNSHVYYNLGYSFTDAYPIDTSLRILQGQSGSLTLSGSLSFAINQFSLGGGLGRTQSKDTTAYRMVDMDGDGHLDVVKVGDNGLSVIPYYHNGGTTSSSLRNTSSIISTTTNDNTTISITAGFTIFIVKYGFGVRSTPWATSSSTAQSDLLDVNGDGYVDYVYASGNNYVVYYNQNGNRPVNLLTSVTNPTGQTLTFDYELTTPSVEKRNRVWNLVQVSDDIYTPEAPQNLTKRFAYSNPYYDNFEKVDYGYANVTTIQNNKKILHEKYDNSSFVSRGEKINDLLLDSVGNKYIGHRHGVTYIYRGSTHNSQTCDDANLYTAEDGYWTDYYDQHEHPDITTGYTLHYDHYHNVTTRTFYGDTIDDSHNWIQQITYLNPANAIWQHNLISLPISDTVVDGHTHQILRVSKASYNPFGQPKEIRQWIDANHMATTDLYYDAFGNLSLVTFPPTSVDTTQRPWNRYVYDAITQTYPIFRENQFAEQYYTGYDLKLGLPIIKIDPSGNSMQYRYDHTGRLVTITAPRESGLHKPATLLYHYQIPNHDLGNQSYPIDPYLRVGQVSYSDGITGLSYCIYDQRGKLIQKKQRKTVFGHDEWVADAVRWYDAFYNVLEYTPPFVSFESLKTPDQVNNPHVSSILRYDVLNRPLTVVNFDGSIRHYVYSCSPDFSGTNRLLTCCVDENGITTQKYQTPQEWVTQQDDGLRNSVHYTYNSMGERILAEDADGYQTTYSYDRLGNCVRRDHPDAGSTRWSYAPFGNIVSMQTAELMNQLDSISYIYSYDRLTDILYPNRTDRNVTYNYDGAGRISNRSDGCGSETFTYDELGNVTSSSRRIIIPSESDAYIFNTRYHYDSFGNIRSIIYPDGDSIAYRYNQTGSLYSIYHYQNSSIFAHSLLKSILYDEQDRKISQVYGNGVQEDYNYDAQSQRLSQSFITLPNNTIIQDLSYYYDYVGNITELNQTAPAYLVLGGPYDMHYRYDNAYRLDRSYNAGGNFNYTYNGTYSPAGRLGTNNLSVTSGIQQGLTYFYEPWVTTHQPRLIIDDVTGEYSNLLWDNNGNLTFAMNCKSGDYRSHFWDEENNLSAVLGPSKAGIYGYDGNGVRVWKMTGQCSSSRQNANRLLTQASFNKLTLYPNPYMAITPEGYTKQYFNGSEHVATSVMNGDLCAFNFMQTSFLSNDEKDRMSTMSNYLGSGLSSSPTISTHAVFVDIDEERQRNSDCDFDDDIYVSTTWANNMLSNSQNCKKGESETVFIHSNHLGSASWVTNSKGLPIQYIHYAPYGDVIANQMTSGYDERYKFIGKERDPESGYDYFGARFLWGNVGIWISVDPLVDKYLSTSPYMYCLGNPIIYYDPDGRSTYTDADGYVTEVRDDTDAGVYRWNQLIEQYDKMGESWHPLSFCNQSKYNDEGIVTPLNMKINFGSTELGDAINSALSENPTLLQYAKNAKSGGIWDLKMHYQEGSIVNGKYASPRDAGNMLAGAVKYRSGIIAPIVQYGYGGYNLSGNSIGKTAALIIGNIGIMTLNIPVGISAAVLIYNGEDKLSQRSIDIGYKYIR